MKKLISLVAIMAAIIVSCVDLPTDVVFPEWNTTARIPITQQSYRLGDIVNLDDEVTIDSSMNPSLYKVRSETYTGSEIVGDYTDGLVDGLYIINSVSVATGDTSFTRSFADQIELYEAVFKNGTISINYQNPSNDPVTLTITIPALKKNNSPFAISGSAAGGETINESRSIVDYTYNSSNISSPSELFIEISAQGNSSTAASNLDISIQNSVFSYIDGVIPGRSSNDINEVFNVDIPDDTQELKGKVIFHDVQFVTDFVYVSNNQNVPEANLISPNFVGRDAFGNTISLTKLDGSPLDDIILDDPTERLVYDESNSNISEFLASMPQTISYFSGTFINPDDKRIEIMDTDVIRVDAYIDINSVISIRGGEVNENEDLDFSAEDRENIDKAESMMLYYELNNQTPLTTDITINFRNSTGILFSKDLILDAGGADYDTQFENTMTYDSIPFDSTEVKLFSMATSVDIEVLIDTDENLSLPYFKPDQVIDLKLWADIVTKLELVEEEEENDNAGGELQ
ncbi:MAG: hypothetical protein Kapaf2KO_09530 [Candidatus Kapaibacteriales bacterium]